MSTRFVEITSIIFLLGMSSALHFLGDAGGFRAAAVYSLTLWNFLFPMWDIPQNPIHGRSRKDPKPAFAPEKAFGMGFDFPVCKDIDKPVVGPKRFPHEHQK